MMIINQRGRVTLDAGRLGFRFETALLYAARLHANHRHEFKQHIFVVIEIIRGSLYTVVHT
jgi:hypothetical protein